MAKESVTTRERFRGDLFEVAGVMSAKDAINFAETALEVSKGLMSEIISGSNSERESDIAFAANFLIDAALACYRSTGMVA